MQDKIRNLKNLNFQDAVFEADTIWILSQHEKIKGLWSVDREKGNVECLLDAEALIDCPTEKYWLKKHMNFLFLIPYDADMLWFIYDIKNKKLERKYILNDLKVGKNTRFSVCKIIGNKLWMFPYYVANPLCCVDLDNFGVEVILNWSDALITEGVQTEKKITLPKCLEKNGMLYITLSDVDYIIQLNLLNQEIQIIKIDSDIKIRDIDISMDSNCIWILPRNKPQLYYWDMELNKLFEYHVAEEVDISVYERIIVCNQGVVLLPFEKNSIIYLDLKRNLWIDVNTLLKKKMIFEKRTSLLFYWGYFKENKIIYIFPYRTNLLIGINTETVEVFCEEIAIAQWSEEELRRQRGLSIRREVLKENFLLDGDLYDLVHCITNRNIGRNITTELPIGKKVWNYFNE